MDRLLRAGCRLLEGFLVLALAAMVLLVFINVVLRYVFNSGVNVSEELSRWLFVWMTFMGAVLALAERGHLGTDTLVSRLPVLGKKLCLGLSLLMMIGVCALVLQGGLEQTRINWDNTSAVMGASMGLFYLSGVVFAVLAMGLLANALWRLISGRLGEHELVGVQETEDVAHGSADPR